MRSLRTTLVFCLFLAWPCAMARQNSSPQTSAAPPVAKMTQYTGEVLVRRTQTWAQVDKVPLDLLSGDTVSTDRGRAEIHFLRDDSTLVLDVGTHLTITESDLGDVGLLRRLQIFLGDVWFHFQRGSNHKTDLVTPTAVGGLRGTEGLVHVEDQSSSEFTLKDGALEIARSSTSSGTTAAENVMLEAGQTLHARTGQPLQPAKAGALPARPLVSVPPTELPKPRENWRDLVSQDSRPPTAGQALPASSRALGPTNSGLAHTKPGDATKPLKRQKKLHSPQARITPIHRMGE